MSSQVEGVVLRGPHAVEANVELAPSACEHRCVKGVQMCQVCTGVSGVHRCVGCAVSGHMVWVQSSNQLKDGGGLGCTS